MPKSNLVPLNNMVEHSTGKAHHFVTPESNTIGTLCQLANSYYKRAQSLRAESIRCEQQYRLCLDAIDRINEATQQQEKR